MLINQIFMVPESTTKKSFGSGSIVCYCYLKYFFYKFGVLSMCAKRPDHAGCKLSFIVAFKLPGTSFLSVTNILINCLIKVQMIINKRVPLFRYNKFNSFILVFIYQTFKRESTTRISARKFHKRGGFNELSQTFLITFFCQAAKSVKWTFFNKFIFPGYHK